MSTLPKNKATGEATIATLDKERLALIQQRIEIQKQITLPILPLQVMGLHNQLHFQNYHRVLSRAIWSSRHVSQLLLQQLVRVFVPYEVLVMGIDDTIERRLGKRIAARA